MMKIFEIVVKNWAEKHKIDAELVSLDDRVVILRCPTEENAKKVATAFCRATGHKTKIAKGKLTDRWYVHCNLTEKRPTKDKK